MSEEAAAGPLRLTPLADAQAALVGAIAAPVAPRRLSLAEAALRPGAALAAPIDAPRALPVAAEALRDGWAVAAADTLGASPHAPSPLPAPPPRVGAGAAMPPGTDAVLAPFDLLTEHGVCQAIQTVAPGDGVRGAGEDIAAGARLRAAGERLRPTDFAALAAWGIDMVELRIARIAWIPVGDEIVADPARDRLGPAIAALAAQSGADFDALPPVGDQSGTIAAALLAAAPRHDLLLLGGGTGAGADDRSAAGLARAGALRAHGIGARPGTSAGFGLVAGRPAILMPGRFEDALAAWILLARPALAALCGAPPPAPRRARLARKIASGVGVAELAVLSLAPDGTAIPRAIGTLPLTALAAADGVLLVPAATEGYEAGTEIDFAPP